MEPPQIEIPQGIDKDSPRGKVLFSVEEIGQRANQEITRINGQFTDLVAEKPALKKPAEAVLESSTMWEKYLSHQEDIETKMAQLQDQYEAAKAGSVAFGNTSAQPNPRGADQARTDALYQEVLDFKVANIPPEMYGLYKIPPEIRDKPIAQEYMTRVEEWKKFAMDERERMQKEREHNKLPDSTKDELALARQEAQAQRERADKLTRQLEEERKARELAENRLVVEQRARQEAEQEADRQRKRAEETIAMANSMRERAERAEAQLAAKSGGTREAGAPAYADEKTNEEVIKKLYPEQPSAEEMAANPSSAEPSERLADSLKNRIRRNLDYLFGGVTGFVTTEAAAGAALWAFPGLGLIGVELASVAATLGWTSLWLGSEYRRVRERLPQVTRFLRGSVVGSLMGTTINTAASALEMAGITNVMPGWPTAGPETVQTAEKVARYVPDALAENQKGLEITVKSEQNLSTIVRDSLHLTNPQEIYRHTVETILGNLDKLPADKARTIADLKPDEVMRNQKLFQLVMDAGKIIHPGQVFRIK